MKIRTYLVIHNIAVLAAILVVILSQESNYKYWGLILMLAFASESKEEK